jgi:hypothetical protein
MRKYWHLSAGKMKVLSFGLLIFSVLAVNAHAQGILGTAGSFGALGEAGVTNTGSSVINGSVAGSTGTPAVTGFPPGTVVAPGVLSLAGIGSGGAGTPFGDATNAFNTLAALSSTNLGGVVQLGGATLNAGVYSVGAALLTGKLTLNFAGPNETIVIDIASTLTTASGPGKASVVLEGNDSTASVYWVVGSSTQIGTYTSFDGNIISSALVAMQTDATDPCGSVISLNAAVTLDTNTTSTGCSSYTSGGSLTPGTGTGYTNLPEGSSPWLYLCFSLLPIGWAFRFRRSRRSI